MGAKYNQLMGDLLRQVTGGAINKQLMGAVQ